jgi:DNA polymerase III gamma/tau subunit
MNWDMIGHDWAVNILRSHLIENKVRHAYLITGPPGIGKRTLALHFLQAVACIEPPSEGEYCNACRACNAISKATFDHSDPDYPYRLMKVIGAWRSLLIFIKLQIKQQMRS